MSPPVWRKLRYPAYGHVETWRARYRGYVLTAYRVKGEFFSAEVDRRVHTRVGFARETHRCQQRYWNVEGAVNAAEYFAEHGRWPHAEPAEATADA